MCLSKRTGLLYLASSVSDPNAVGNHVYALSIGELATAGLSAEDLNVQMIAIHGMGHITGITTDPAAGRVWAAGFSMEGIPNDFCTRQFYHPYLAIIEPGTTQATAIPLSDPASAAMGNDLALPMSIVWIPEPTEPCGPADINRDGRVDLADFLILSSQWLATGAGLPSDIATPPDGIVNVHDLAALAEGWLGCTN